ncbi:ImcF-related family protein [Silvimonas sp.]|uniref:ImcF-related family protein n=1 Tax=Silvimonas sp. TaxID=2650811 RepID=UPI00284007C6|nr:ImcF-related family protein [Silvimonas sp.]MDR3428732.1 ImcF-related family protein [Silvimonas sp.]
MFNRINFRLAALLVVFASISLYVLNKGAGLGLATPEQRWLAVAGIALLYLLSLVIWLAFVRRKKEKEADKDVGSAAVVTINKTPAPEVKTPFDLLHDDQKSRYGWFERRFKPWLLVTGAESLVRPHFPGLLDQKWLDTPRAVLVWAGDGVTAPAKGWRYLRGRLRKPADGVVLVTDGASQQGSVLANLTRDCGYALPVQLVLSPAVPGERGEESPAILLQTHHKVANDTGQISAALQQLVDPLSQTGLWALLKNRKAYFDAGLSAFLEQRHDTLGKWIGQLARNLQRRQVLAGIWFTPAPALVSDPQALTGADDAAHVELAQVAGDNITLPGPWLQTFRRARKPKLHFSGFDWFWSVLAVCVGLWCAGTVVSYLQNRALAEEIRADIATLQSAPKLKQAFPALLAVQNDMALLEAREKNGAPWTTRFGLNHNAELLAATWQPYGLAANKWLMRPVQTQLASHLKVLNAVPLDGMDAARNDDENEGTGNNTNSGATSRDAIGQMGYDTLKTWLMLSQPKHTDAPFLAPRLAQTGKAVWPSLSVDGVEQVTKFYANHLADHPEWKLAENDDVLFAARQTLSGLIDLKQADDTLYGQLLDNTKSRYPDPTMGMLLGGRDSRGLWSVQGRLPGTFTRQAYEGYVRDAIAQMSRQAVTNGDWVLGQQSTPNAVKPEDLQASLTKRYFTDFGYAWQNFLNRLNWVPEANLSGTAEQLRVYADAQQSPLSALMKTIAWQAQAGAQQHSLADSLVEKAQNVFKGKDGYPATTATPQDSPKSGAPLAEAFGPLLRLVDNADGSSNAASGAASGGASADTTLSLQRYLDRVSVTRLKLDQVNAAADPDAFALQLAQSLFQGQANDLVDARNYAELVAASLGSGYAGMGQNLFLKPFDQSWRTLMQPASASLNSLWTTSVWLPFNSAVGGRFPFNNTDNEVGLPELARFISPQGIVPQFAKTQLGGILVLQGDQWVPNPRYAQSLKFDTEFLNGLNQLSRLASRMYAEGDTRYRFDIMAMGHPKLIDSVLSIDGQSLDYFNQKQQWEHFTWPGTPEKAGAHLTWSTLQAGLQKKEDFNSVWGFVRLLAKAKVEQIDRASYRVEWTLDDDIRLRYAVRTQAGAGPLELLQLKGFKLPERVFVTGREIAAPKPESAPTGIKSPAAKPS